MRKTKRHKRGKSTGKSMRDPLPLSVKVFSSSLRETPLLSSSQILASIDFAKK